MVNANDRVVNNNAGFSLFEILLALGLGSIVMINLLILFVSFSRSIQSQQQLSDQQENMRFASYFLSQRIRMAGDRSCEGKNLVDSVHAIRGYDDPDVGKVLQIGACIFYQSRIQWMQTIYFVADTGRRDHKNKPILGLYEKPLGHAREEIVDGVENLHILYGVRASPHATDIAFYLSASEVRDWQLVHSVELKWSSFYLYIALRELL